MSLSYAEHKELMSHVRNKTLEEVAQAIEKFTGAFGADTVASFAIFVRNFKE